jgi:hypothetical protein
VTVLPVAWARSVLRPLPARRILIVFPFISVLSVLGRRASDDFCSRNELFLLGVRVSFWVFGLYLVHNHVIGSVTRWRLLIFRILLHLSFVLLGFLYIQG